MICILTDHGKYNSLNSNKLSILYVNNVITRDSFFHPGAFLWPVFIKNVSSSTFHQKNSGNVSVGLRDFS